MKIAKLNELLDRNEIVNFHAHEFGRLKNENWDGPNFLLPPVEDLHLIIPAMSCVQQVRHYVGPVRLNSVYRPQEYTDILPGRTSDDSQHGKFTAVDFSPIDPEVSWEEFVGVCAAVVEVVKFQCDMHNAHHAPEDHLFVGFFLYPDSGFCHLDIGPFREKHITKRFT